MNAELVVAFKSARFVATKTTLRIPFHMHLLRQALIIDLTKFCIPCNEQKRLMEPAHMHQFFWVSLIIPGGIIHSFITIDGCILRYFNGDYNFCKDNLSEDNVYNGKMSSLGMTL